MKLIYIGVDFPDNYFISYCKSFAIEVIHYTNPLKATDNFIEIKPDFVYIKHTNYPRMWKIVLTSLREGFDNNKSKYILEGKLNEEDEKAFNFLNGNNIINNLDDFKNIIKKEIGVFTPLKTYLPQSGEFGLGFVNPADYSFISCDVLQLFSEYLIISSDCIENLSNFLPGTVISAATISYGDTMVEIDLEILDNSGNLTCRISKGREKYSKILHSLFV